MADTRDPHPLFPVSDNDDDPDAPPPEVCFILVTRREAAGIVTAPHVFPAGDLTGLEQLHALYGGGIYELIGRGENNARIVARRSYTLPGSSKPLFKQEEMKAEAAQAMPAEVVAALKMFQTQQAPQGGLNVATIVTLLGALGPVIAQYLSNSAAAAARQHEAQQNFLATLLTQSQTQSDKFVSVMQSLHNQAPGAATAGNPAEFKKGVDWAMEFLAGQMEGKAENASEMDFNELMKTVQLGLQAMQQQAPNGAPHLHAPQDGKAAS